MSSEKTICYIKVSWWGDYSIDTQTNVLTSYIYSLWTECSVGREDIVGNLIAIYGPQILYMVQ